MVRLVEAFALLGSQGGNTDLLVREQEDKAVWLELGEEG